MKRVVFKVILFLLVGAIVNVAVAEFFILTKTGLPPVMREGDTKIWPSEVPNHWPPMNEHMFFDSVAWSWEEFSYRATQGYDEVALRLYSAGFPLRSLVREDGFEYRSGVGISGVQRNPSVWRDGMHVQSLNWTLALMPLWPGFAINTLFYAVILWLLFAAPFALRRRRRIKRGLCPKCAYDLRNRPSDSSACPECGAASQR